MRLYVTTNDSYPELREIDAQWALEWIRANPAYEWVQAHPTFAAWVFGLSAATFVGTLVAVPMLVVRIPPDYFTGRRRHRIDDPAHPLRRLALRLAKNLAGWVFIIAGIVMLLVPGQGLITILIGLMLVNFPGKFRFERWLVSRPPVLRSINWLRRRRGRPPLEVALSPGPGAPRPASRPAPPSG